jgi:hypothetical protein
MKTVLEIHVDTRVYASDEEKKEIEASGGLLSGGPGRNISIKP